LEIMNFYVLSPRVVTFDREWKLKCGDSFYLCFVNTWVRTEL